MWGDPLLRVRWREVLPAKDTRPDHHGRTPGESTPPPPPLPPPQPPLWRQPFFCRALRQVSTSNFEVPDEATVDKVAPALEDLLQSSMDAVFGGPDGEPFDDDDD